MNPMTQSNKKGWDGLAESHYKNYPTDKLLAGKPLLHDLVLNEVGDVRDKSLAHLLCHIGTDTLSWALLGAKVTGVDISPESLKYARMLADQMGLSADFIEADILDVMDKVNDKFDIVFSSVGVLCWLPDIKRYAQTVRHLLNDGGFFYIYDGHPFRSVMVNDAGSTRPNTFQGSYFRKEVWEFKNMGDYIDRDLKIPFKSYEWNWMMGEIITAFCEVGMRIEFLHEFPQYLDKGMALFDMDYDKIEFYPCTFSLKATAI